MLDLKDHVARAHADSCMAARTDGQGCQTSCRQRRTRAMFASVLVRNAAARDVGDELLAAGRHQERRVDLELERVDAPGLGLAVRRHDVAAGVAADVLVHLEAVAGEDRRHRLGQRQRARGVVTRADDHLVVLHPPGAAGVAVEQQRVAVPSDGARVEQLRRGSRSRDRTAPAGAPRDRRARAGGRRSAHRAWCGCGPPRAASAPRHRDARSRRAGG